VLLYARVCIQLEGYVPSEWKEKNFQRSMRVPPNPIAFESPFFDSTCSPLTGRSSNATVSLWSYRLKGGRSSRGKVDQDESRRRNRREKEQNDERIATCPNLCLVFVSRNRSIGHSLRCEGFWQGARTRTASSITDERIDFLTSSHSSLSTTNAYFRSRAPTTQRRPLSVLIG
jgi:hypothetical protein